jgi:hypothetical protein
VARHQDDQLDPLAEEKRVGAYQDRANPLLLDGRERAARSWGELPVVLPTKFHLVINLKTAKSLGIDIPGTVRPNRSAISL